MYHSDSKVPVIWAYDYDTATGAVSGRRVVARPTEEVGRPDGAATDEEGYYWSAGISAGVLNRWAPMAGWTAASRCRAPIRPRRVSAART